MSDSSRHELDNPFFARFYKRNRKTADRRGELEHRRRVLEGLSGRVVELGAGDGANFSLYPATVTEVVAVEPERHLRADAEAAAGDAPVPVIVVSAFADALPVDDGSIDAVLASLVLCTVPDVDAALAEARRVLAPGGELRFYEHVHADQHPLKGLLEVADRSTLWPRVAGGCHPNRHTEQAIGNAGFEIASCERFRFSPSVISPRVPHILGVARPIAAGSRLTSSGKPAQCDAVHEVGNAHVDGPGLRMKRRRAEKRAGVPPEAWERGSGRYDRQLWLEWNHGRRAAGRQVD